MMLEQITSQKARRYLYVVAASVVPALILWGVISDAEAAVYLNIVAAVLALGTSTTAAHFTGDQYETRRSDSE